MTNWVLPFGRQQLNSYQLTLSILKTSPDRNNNLIVLINSPSTLQDYPNLFHVVDNIFTTWRSWWFWLYSMLTCIFLLYPAFVIGFLSDHVSLSCMLWKNNRMSGLDCDTLAELQLFWWYPICKIFTVLHYDCKVWIGIN